MDQKLIDEFERIFKTNVLNVWYPRCIDEINGGFITTLSRNWQATGNQQKNIVHQSRHLYSTAAIYMYTRDPVFLGYARHGFNFIKDKMWDKQYGGFYYKVSQQAEPAISETTFVKNAYGNAFAIYACATYYEASGDNEALELAKRTFYWLEEHSHDRLYEGYFDQLNEKGTPIETMYLDKSEGYLSGAGFKDQNSTIHLLEAFTSLYRVWPNKLVKTRLEELVNIISGRIVSEQGHMILNFEQDWTPYTLRDKSAEFRKNNQFFDHVSFGHDIETAYLLLEAFNVLNKPLDHDLKVLIRKMTDHTINKGWDAEFNGIYYEGWYDDTFKHIAIIDSQKAWWPQVESLNTLLLLSRLFPEEETYASHFRKQWEQIKKYQIDHLYGGFYECGIDRNPELADNNKSHAWKANYHTVRAFINCLKILKSDHELMSYISANSIQTN